MTGYDQFWDGVKSVVRAEIENEIRNDLLRYIERKCVDWSDPDSPVVPLSEIHRLLRQDI